MAGTIVPGMERIKIEVDPGDGTPPSVMEIDAHLTYSAAMRLSVLDGQPLEYHRELISHVHSWPLTGLSGEPLPPTAETLESDDCPMTAIAMLQAADAHYAAALSGKAPSGG